MDKIKKFLSRDIWDIDLKKLPPLKSFLFKFIKGSMIVVKGFSEDKCLLR